MKIGFSGFILDEGKSGISTYILELLKAITEIDHKNHYDLLINERDRSLVDQLSTSLSIESHKKIWENPVANIIWHNLVLPFSKYDLVHIPDSRRVPLVKGTKIVATVHDMGPSKIPDKYGKMRGLYHQYLTPRCLQNCDHIICVSHATKRDLIDVTNYPENKISVIYSGINGEKFRPLDAEKVKNRIVHRYGLKKPYFIYVSRIEHPAKNHYNLIKAFQIFKDTHHSNHQLVLTGALWNRSDIVESAIRSSKYQGDIQFLGFVPDEDLVYLYNGCEAMVFPSLHEGFGFPLLESMACGAPVACSNGTSLKELGEGYAHLFDPHEPEDIAEKMDQAMNQSEDHTRKNLQYAQSFKWSTTAERVLQVYNRI